MSSSNSDNPPHKSSPTDWIKQLKTPFKDKLKPKNLDELRAVLRLAMKDQILKQDSYTMIEGVLDVTHMQVRDIMIPRSQMITLDHQKPLCDLLPMIIDAAHSRFPVIGENKDDILGILLAKDLLKLLANNNASLKEPLSNTIIRPATIVPESKSLESLLKEFRSSRNHMAIVADEYGGISGVVTIEDVLEEIVGEIEDEFDSVETQTIHKKTDSIYVIDGMTLIEDFNSYFKTELNDNEVDTIGGLIMKTLGYVPHKDDQTQIDGIAFKVLQANERTIESLEVEISRAKPHA